MTVVILDRPRHSEIIKECRAAGARIRLISDGDVGAAIEVAKQEAPVDILFGVGGTPEGAAPTHFEDGGWYEGSVKDWKAATENVVCPIDSVSDCLYRSHCGSCTQVPGRSYPGPLVAPQ